MAETLNPPLQGNPGKLIRLADLPGTGIEVDTGIEVPVEIEPTPEQPAKKPSGKPRGHPAESGVLPPLRAPAVKQPQPATTSPDPATGPAVGPEVGRKEPKPAETRPAAEES